jgi:hypothetical protein
VLPAGKALVSTQAAPRLALPTFTSVSKGTTAIFSVLPPVTLEFRNETRFVAAVVTAEILVVPPIVCDIDPVLSMTSATSRLCVPQDAVEVALIGVVGAPRIAMTRGTVARASALSDVAVVVTVTPRFVTFALSSRAATWVWMSCCRLAWPARGA